MRICTNISISYIFLNENLTKFYANNFNKFPFYNFLHMTENFWPKFAKILAKYYAYMIRMNNQPIFIPKLVTYLQKELHYCIILTRRNSGRDLKNLRIAEFSNLVTPIRTRDFFVAFFALLSHCKKFMNSWTHPFALVQSGHPSCLHLAVPLRLSPEKFSAFSNKTE